jgi:hypothetical protein
MDLFDFIDHVFSLSNEALPQAPAPAEVAHPQNERAAGHSHFDSGATSRILCKGARALAGNAGTILQ